MNNLSGQKTSQEELNQLVPVGVIDLLINMAHAQQEILSRFPFEQLANNIAKIFTPSPETASQLQEAQASFQRLCNELHPAFEAISSNLDKLASFIKQFDPDALCEAFEVVRTINDIGLDLTPYEDIPFSAIIDALHGQKPCDYKQILEQKFLNRSTTAETLDIALSLWIKLLELISLILEIYLTCLQIEDTKLRIERERKLSEELPTIVQEYVEDYIEADKSRNTLEQKRPSVAQIKV